MELKERVVVVTGAARGIGRASVRGFLSSGARVVATDKSWAGADEFRREVEASKKGLILNMDVTDKGQIDEAYQVALREFDTIDVLVNNAGLLQMFLFPSTGKVTTLETADEDWVKMFDVNVLGPLRVIRRFAAPMLDKRRGSIVNIVSSGVLNFSRGGGYMALRPNSREMPYMASKAALATMSFYLADEIRERNVAVNTIIPGHTRGAWFDDTIRARIAAGLPPGGRPVSPEHIVPLMLSLASQDGSGVTGRMFDAMEWNLEHDDGGYGVWRDRSLPADIDEAFTRSGVP
ncbi:MAG TPA: SDR family oxidoreductase [Candidatus Binatia bacterium]